MVVVSRVGDYWVTDEQAQRIAAVLESGKKGMIKLDGNFIAINSIDGVVNASAYEVLNNKRRGAWQCKYQHWHDRGDKCAHYLQHKLLDRSSTAMLP